MSEPVITPSAAAAVAATTGVVTYPFFAQIGLDPAAMGAGLLGCTIAQSFIESKGRTIWSVVLFTLGSVLFASLAAPVVTPWVQVKLGEWFPKVAFPSEGVRTATAAGLGFFAQPIVLFVKGWGFDKLRRMLPGKEGGNA
jgi:hypothetical protein